MRLSEAIRLGAMQGPQIFGDWYGPNSASCALGAAAMALGIDRRIDGYLDPLSKYFPRLNYWLEREDDTLASKILRLNDHNKLSREAIADWLVGSGYDCESISTTTPLTENQYAEEVELCC